MLGKIDLHVDHFILSLICPESFREGVILGRERRCDMVIAQELALLALDLIMFAFEV